MPGMSILLVEDDPELGKQIAEHLRRAAFSVVWWRRGRTPDAEDLAELSLVVLDLMLPEQSGFDVLKQIRARSDVPVLVLSARNTTTDKVTALRLGADDYMTKPFWPEELEERVRARLRRPALARNARSSRIELGPLHIDREQRQAWLDGSLLQLTRAELDFLLALAERPGDALTRAALATRALDPDRDSNERTLDVHASRLRKKLGGAPNVQIETVWGIGYRLRVVESP